jgi:hypothetical protein
VKQYNRYLRDLIISGKASPGFVVSHEVGIDEAEVAYEKFDKRIDGYTSKFLVFSLSAEIPSPCLPRCVSRSLAGGRETQRRGIARLTWVNRGVGAPQRTAFLSLSSFKSEVRIKTKGADISPSGTVRGNITTAEGRVGSQARYRESSKARAVSVVVIGEKVMARQQISPSTGSFESLLRLWNPCAFRSPNISF